MIFAVPAWADTAACTTENSEQCSEQTLEKIVVIGNRTPTKTNEYAGQMSSLSANRLQNSSRLIEALDAIPGINHGVDVGRPVGQALSMRGFTYGQGGRIIIEQDGVPRDPGLYSLQIASFRTDSDILKRVETVNGASSVLHGSGAIGGVISMQTKGAHDYLRAGQEFGVGVGARYESNNMQSGMVQLYGAPSKLPIDFLIHTKYAHYGDIRLADGGGGYYSAATRSYKRIPETKNDDRTLSFFTKLGWDITPEQRLTFSLFNMKSNLDYVWQAITIADSEIPNIETPTTGTLKQRDIILDYRYKPTDNPWVNFNAKIYYGSTTHHRYNHGVASKDSLTNEDKRWGITLKNESRFQAGAWQHTLVAGLEYKNARQDFSHTRPNGYVADLKAFPNESHDTSVYLQDNVRYGRWLFTLGGRLDYFNRKVRLAGAQTARNHRFSPRVAVSFEAFSGLNLLAGYAETFRAPTPVETGQAGNINNNYYMLANPDLKPELAKEYEVGFAWNKKHLFTANDQIAFKATYFNGNVRDLINLTRLGTAGSTPTGIATQYYGQYQNISQVKRTGYELDLRYQTERWKMGIAYGHTKLYNRVTHRLAAAYAGKINAYVDYTYQPWGLTAGVELRHWLRPKNVREYASANPNPYNRYVHNSFTIMNLRGAWQPANTGIAFLDQGVRVSFGINNIFDRQAKRAGDYDLSSDAVGTGRNYYLQMEKRF